MPLGDEAVEVFSHIRIEVASEYLGEDALRFGGCQYRGRLRDRRR